MAKGDLTAEALREQFDYIPATGELVRKPTRQNRNRPVVAAGKDAKGYLRASVNGHQYRVHRLVWLYHYGEWPTQVIDHINRNKADNRIENLRDVSPAENTRNRDADGNWGCGYSVTFTPDRPRPYRAKYRSHGRDVNVGYFDTRDEAVRACLVAKGMLGRETQPNHQLA